VPDDPTVQPVLDVGCPARPAGVTVSLRELARLLLRRRWLVLSIEAGLLALCLLYCLLAPRTYEARARVEMRATPVSALNLDANPSSSSSLSSISALSAPVALETLAGVFRSDQLAWRVIVAEKLYANASFNPRFPHFDPARPDPVAESWLLARFHTRLRVQALPRTLILEIRFRSKDPALAAAAANALMQAYAAQDSEARRAATREDSGWLQNQLVDLKSRVDLNQKKLDDFQRAHGILAPPTTSIDGKAGTDEHNAALLEIDELGRQMVVATSERILAEAEARAASNGDPEQVASSDPRLMASTGEFPLALLQQLRAHHSELEQERAQLSAEHGPNFPRVIEIGRQLLDLEAQRRAEDAKLLAHFRSAWQTAVTREQMVRKSLDEATAEGMRLNLAETEYARMRQEADASHDLYTRVLARLNEAGLAAGIHGSKIAIVDLARPPMQPVAPNPPLYLGITFFVGLWIALCSALLAEMLSKPTHQLSVALLLILIALLVPFRASAQAPTPSTSGLPTGVAHVIPRTETRELPNPKQAPLLWDNPMAAIGSATPGPPAAASAAPMTALIGPGDLLDISEVHTPEFHSTVRVSPTGTVTLPMIHEIHIAGLGESGASRAIEAALIAQGMLLHPLVAVFVTSYAGQDVSVLGEVTRPGVYPYTLHHRLLDLLSAASGLSQSAGRLVNIYHRDDAKIPHPVVLDPSGADTTVEHNPELFPGDTVQVSRAGLIYVIGDVIRPGGFSVDPAQGLTVVQALSLAWGPTQNAGTRRALLIREQKGGRTITTLNLKRMLHGQDPDQLVHDRDILYVPDSTARSLMNRTLESAIQSTIGVAIYSGLVYSQRY
jgi:polysaccharide export outer membrane protein